MLNRIFKSDRFWDEREINCQALIDDFENAQGPSFIKRSELYNLGFPKVPTRLNVDSDEQVI